MKDIPRPILRNLVQRYGESVARDPLRCEALLRDTCGACGREIFVLVSAVRQHVPLDLVAPRHNLPLSLMKGFMIKRLQDELGLSDEAARWAVETWAYALDLTEAENVQESSAGSSRAGPVPDSPTPRPAPDPAQLKQWAENLESGRVSEGIAAVRNLARAGDDRSIRILVAALNHSRWAVRYAAYEALVSLALPAVPALADALKSPDDLQVSRAVLILAAIRSRAATESLCSLLGRERFLDLLVIFALGEIGDAGAVSTLSRCLTSADPDISLAAAGALRRLT